MDLLRRLVTDARVVLLGEMHGNTAGPAALLEATRLSLELGPTSVGLEAPELETTSFQTFVESEGNAADREALLAGSFWSPLSFDGRANQAMLEMLDELRKLRRGGADVLVFGFLRIGDHNSGNQNPHEQRMADGIVEHARGNPSRRIVALAGNLHVQRSPFQFGNRSETVPMASRVLSEIEATLTIKLVYDGGETWVCASGGLQKLALAPSSDDLRDFAVDRSGTFHALWPVGPALPSRAAHPDVSPSA